jgi:hypothetical protein
MDLINSVGQTINVIAFMHCDENSLSFTCHFCNTFICSHCANELLNNTGIHYCHNNNNVQINNLNFDFDENSDDNNSDNEIFEYHDDYDNDYDDDNELNHDHDSDFTTKISQNRNN